MANHGPRLRMLRMPSAKSRIAILPNASHGPIAAGFGGCVGGPVDVSTAAGFGEADGANASTPAVDAAVPVGSADVGVFGGAAGERVTAAGAFDVGAGAQTWLKRMDGGGAPKADV